MYRVVSIQPHLIATSIAFEELTEALLFLQWANSTHDSMFNGGFVEHYINGTWTLLQAMENRKNSI